jgi:pyruvate,orthophosphate dikinase
VDAYGAVPEGLKRLGETEGEGERWKLLFLVRIMGLEGLSTLWEETLRKIHRTMSGLLERETAEEAKKALEAVFPVLRWSIRSYPSTALNSLLNIGRAVAATGRRRLIARFVEDAADLDFQGPDLGMAGDTFSSRENTAHVQNIRTWMELIGLYPPASRKLLSCLTIHLALRGVLIRDVDFFPRDITRFLNSDIGPVYNQAKQLARLLPAYFNEIGAEGRLRDVSTRIDEILSRKDALVHFLRKQSHVESSNRIVGLVEGVLSYWWTGRRGGLRSYVPSDLYQALKGGDDFPEGIHRLLTHLEDSGRIARVEDLLVLDQGEVRGAAGRVEGVTETDVSRLELAIEFYQLLYQKYRLGTVTLERYLEQAPLGTFPDLDSLKKALVETDPHRKIQGLLDYLERLREIILSPETFEVKEDIYHKRHIAADIPSVYGSYHEAK